MSKAATTDNTPAVIDASPATIDAHPELIDPDDEWSDVGDGDLTQDGATSRLPYFKLNRKMGGGFVDPDTGEILQTLDFVWLARGRSRAQWDRLFDGKAADEDKAPVCRSFDGLTPDPTSPTRKADHCAGCPNDRFSGFDDQVQQHQRCHRSVEAMVFVADTTPGGGRLVRLRFGGMAESAARAYWDSFKTRLPARPAIAFMSRCTLEEVDTSNGVFLVPRFERVHELRRAEAQPLIAVRDEMVKAWQEDIADAVRAQESNGDQAEAGATAKANEPFPEYDKPMGGEEFVAKMTRQDTGRPFVQGDEDVF